MLKTFSLFAVFAMVAFAGCGSDDEPSTEPPATTALKTKQAEYRKHNSFVADRCEISEVKVYIALNRSASPNAALVDDRLFRLMERVYLGVQERPRAVCGALHAALNREQF